MRLTFTFMRFHPGDFGCKLCNALIKFGKRIAVQALAQELAGGIAAPDRTVIIIHRLATLGAPSQVSTGCRCGVSRFHSSWHTLNLC